MNGKSKPHGTIVWIAWSSAMLLLLFYVIDIVFEFNLLTFQVFMAIMMFFNILLLLINLSWILVLKNNNDGAQEKYDLVFRKSMFTLEQQAQRESERERSNSDGDKVEK
jgi:hypothetical protein